MFTRHANTPTRHPLFVCCGLQNRLPRPPLGIAGIPGARPLLARAGQSPRSILRDKRVPTSPSRNHRGGPLRRRPGPFPDIPPLDVQRPPMYTIQRGPSSPVTAGPSAPLPVKPRSRNLSDHRPTRAGSNNTTPDIPPVDAQWPPVHTIQHGPSSPMTAGPNAPPPVKSRPGDPSDHGPRPALATIVTPNQRRLCHHAPTTIPIISPATGLITHRPDYRPHLTEQPTF